MTIFNYKYDIISKNLLYKIKYTFFRLYLSSVIYFIQNIIFNFFDFNLLSEPKINYYKLNIKIIELSEWFLHGAFLILHAQFLKIHLQEQPLQY